MNAAPIGETPGPAVQPATLLVVEDDVLTRHLVCDSLRQEGYKVVEASSALEAIAVLRTVAVDMLFVDVHMPGSGGDGVSVARFARAHQPAARILLTSGKVLPASIPDLASLGSFLAKPYLISRVVDLVQRTLDGR